MAERVLFLTGHLARARLEKLLNEAGGFGLDWSIVDIGVKVAALMTEAIITRRLARPVLADRVVVPGRCRADLERLTAAFGVRFERGPDELKDLPAHFGRRGRGLDLTRHDMRIFAEIVDASALDVDAIVARAGFSRPVRNFVAVLIDKRRTRFLSEIVKQFARDLNERLGIAEVEVTTARHRTPAARGSTP